MALPPSPRVTTSKLDWISHGRSTQPKVARAGGRDIRQLAAGTAAGEIDLPQFAVVLRAGSWTTCCRWGAMLSAEVFPQKRHRCSWRILRRPSGRCHRCHEASRELPFPTSGVITDASWPATLRHGARVSSVRWARSRSGLRTVRRRFVLGHERGCP